MQNIDKINQSNGILSQNGKSRKKPMKLFTLFLLYRIALDVITVNVLIPIFSYSLLNPNFSYDKLLVSLALTIIFIRFSISYYSSLSISKGILAVLDLVYFFPSFVYFAWFEVSWEYLGAVILFWVLLKLFYKLIPVLKIGFSHDIFSDLIFNIFLISMIIFAVALSGAYNGFRLNLNLTNVYDLRAEQKIMDLPGVTGYLQPLAAVIIPFSIIYFLDKKAYFVSGLCVIAQLLLFSFGGVKTYLFYVPIVIIAYYFTRRRPSSEWLVKGLIMVCLVSLAEYLLFDSYYATAYLVRRNLFVPVHLSTVYQGFFTTHTPDFWSQSIMRRFGFESEYSIKIPELIGQQYFFESYANTGLIGDAFANFGWAGVFLYPLLISFALKFIESCARGIPLKFTIVFSIIYGLIFTNGAFWTVMSTNGFIAVSIMLLFLPREKYNGDKL